MKRIKQLIISACNVAAFGGGWSLHVFQLLAILANSISLQFIFPLLPAMWF